MYLKLLSVVILFLPVLQGANILAIIAMPSYSHQIAYTQLWRELSLRGHKVTSVTTDPLKDPSLTNLTEIDMKWTYKFFEDVSKMAENTLTMWNFYDVMVEKILLIVDAYLGHAPIQDLIYNRNGSSFDVILVEFIFPEFLALAEIYKCPKILISSMDTNQYIYSIMGNPTHPALHSDFVTPFYGSLNFKERVINTLHSWYLSYKYVYKLFSKRQPLVRNYFNTTSTIEEYVNSADMLFLNVNPLIQSPRALGPTTITIGGQRKILSPKPLPEDLKKFLDSANNGFIYFSLGSNVKSRELNEETIKAIVETLQEIPYKVLWKYEDEYLPGKPENVKLVKWAPQQNILSHPNIKLFITQGGLQSMEEAIYSEVPLVVIPFFADQEQNAKLMTNKGIGKTVSRLPFIEKTSLKNAILEVINNPSYKNSVEKLKRLALDTPMTGLEKAVWWTEYVIRNKGAKHLRNPAADLPLYQYYLIDVISFFVLSVLLALSVLIFLVKLLFKTISIKLYRISNSDKKIQ